MAVERKVKHFIITPEAYQKIMQLLHQIPYGQVAQTMSAINTGVRPIFDRQKADPVPISTLVENTDQEGLE